MAHFGDRLIEAVRARGTPLCVGIDPHLDLIPRRFRRGEMKPGNTATTEAVRDLCFALLERLRGKVAVIKPQAAFFEMLGPGGMVLLAELSREAMALELLVVMDAKRGDIGSSSPADALTVNPFLGMDTLAPFTKAADATGSGLFILNRTSNAGSADIQGIMAEDGRPVFHHLADKLKPLIEDRIGTSGFSSLGIVAGATWPEEAALLRRLLPSALFLVPGFGAQGGGAAEALAGFIDGPEGLEGGIVNSSRGISFPEEAADAGSDADWRQAIDRAIDTSVTSLRG